MSETKSDTQSHAVHDVAALPVPRANSLAGASLFLDFDGTLVDLADTPEAVVVPAQLPALLANLDTALHGRLAIVSGRDIKTLRDDFGLTNVTLAGSHGAQIAMLGQPVDSVARAAALDTAYAHLIAFAQSHPDLVVEDKPLGIGLHYRQAPAMKERCQDEARKVASAHNLSLQHGKMMIELRGEKAHKGMAIARLMETARFAGGRPVFIGDDVTDEDGFTKAAQLGGAGIKVGVSGKTGARYALANVRAVHEFLTSICAQQFPENHRHSKEQG